MPCERVDHGRTDRDRPRPVLAVLERPEDWRTATLARELTIDPNLAAQEVDAVDRESQGFHDPHSRPGAEHHDRPVPRVDHQQAKLQMLVSTTCLLKRPEYIE